jgi:hypothetical protein
MERKSTENIWKGGKYKDDSARVERGGISDSMGWEIGQYAVGCVAATIGRVGQEGLFSGGGASF